MKTEKLYYNDMLMGEGTTPPPPGYKTIAQDESTLTRIFVKTGSLADQLEITVAEFSDLFQKTARQATTFVKYPVPRN